MERKAGNNDLGSIAQRRVEQPSHCGTQKFRQDFGGLAHQCGQRNDRQRRSEKHQNWVRADPVEDDSDRDKHEQPVQIHLSSQDSVSPSQGMFTINWASPTIDCQVGLGP